ncbi:BLUF domain protein [Pseudoalteromonas sp. BSi20652]|uniref:BLUF domain-containing protein n=1 Tax=Pseudoalteromonas sp. BSi20652 TaxID=388384 RepID=UPI0002319645|nr:BLUF domain-containing protein [Pseudoalteromonas sp. BSi20652]GAA58858.1 BLUF domain protein [Pseudoalteromonas sp. BSi20652]
MFLVRLIYASKITDGFGPKDIENILQSARTYNVKKNVTGMLCFSNDYFLQCLEGSRTAVNNTYQQILNDKRHHNVIMLNYNQIPEREFEKWSMGYVPQSKVTESLNLKFSGSIDFNPFKMSGDSAHRLMLALKGSITGAIS